MPPGDVLIHAGDATWRGLPSEIVEFGNWMRIQEYAKRIFVPGNHDILFETDLKKAMEYLGDGIDVLINAEVKVDGVNIFGSPWTPAFGKGWAFQLKDREHQKMNWDLLYSGIQVLVTHGPAYKVGDWAGEHMGDNVLQRRIHDIEPLAHIHGHIHEGYGVNRSSHEPWPITVNAAICDGQYKPVNLPIVINI